MAIPDPGRNGMEGGDSATSSDVKAGLWGDAHGNHRLRFACRLQPLGLGGEPERR